jgi:hypothetical protein
MCVYMCTALANSVYGSCRNAGNEDVSAQNTVHTSKWRYADHTRKRLTQNRVIGSFKWAHIIYYIQGCALTV